MEGEAFLQGFPPDRAAVERKSITNMVFPCVQRKGNDGASFHPSQARGLMPVHKGFPPHSGQKRFI